MIVSTDDAVSDNVINRCRLQPSETKPATKIAIASEAVVTDTDSALCAGLTPKARGEFGQERLHAVEQREGRVAGEEKRERCVPVSTRAAFEIRRGIG